MTIHLGTDIVYIPRIQAALDRFGERFLSRIYTQIEQQDCAIKTLNWLNSHQQLTQVSVARLAGRWAAKEAVVKALGTGWKGVGYTDVEIQRSSTGAPQVFLSGMAAKLVASWGTCQWQVSISHDGDYCTTTAIAWSESAGNER